MKRMAHEGMTLSKGTCLSHGGVPDPDSKDPRFGRGSFLGCVGLGGGRAGGLGFSAGGGLCWGGAAGAAGGGLNPQLDSRISSSAHPSHHNSPMYSTTVKCPQVLKFLFFMLSIKKEGTANFH